MSKKVTKRASKVESPAESPPKRQKDSNLEGGVKLSPTKAGTTSSSENRERRLSRRKLDFEPTPRSSRQETSQMLETGRGPPDQEVKLLKKATGQGSLHTGGQVDNSKDPSDQKESKDPKDSKDPRDLKK